MDMARIGTVGTVLLSRLLRQKNRPYCPSLILIFMLTLSISGCGKTSNEAASATDNLPTIIVGSDDFRPFNYKDAAGQATGIDVELAAEAFKRMGYHAIFQNIDWSKKTELVESGAIDCIWGSFSINGREDDYHWSKPYMNSRQVVAVRSDSNIDSLSDLEGKRIAVQSTTKPEGIFLDRTDARIPEIYELVTFPKQELMYPQLSKGYVDAIAAHETSIVQYMSDYSLDFKILDEPLLEVNLGVAFAKNDDRGLNEKLSEVFEEMRNDGTMEKIIGKYLEDPQKYMEVNEDAE